MMREIVTVTAGGSELSGWKSVSAEFGASQAARSFSLAVTEQQGAFGDVWRLAPGTEVTILATGDPLLAGYVDCYKPAIDKDAHEVTVTGRSKGADAVDCSATHKTGRWEKKTLLEIAKELDPGGVGFISQEKLRQLDKHQLIPGETVFESLERRCRHEGLLMIGKADGSISFEKAGKKRAAGALIQGYNILRATATLDHSGRHSKAIARGQRAHGHGAKALRVEKQSQDGGIKRNRPLVVLHEGEADDDAAQARAEWEVKRRIGWSTTAEIAVQGWRDEDGVLWEGNTLIYVESPALKIDQDMLINAVRLEQSDNGTIATLSLVDPRALGGSSPGGKSSGAWSAP
ncbi:phage baseplate assembly protein [Labrys wisconsinensis]|uniref:Prophage tail gpP-like protein n=1 Tax=Labrys wisconsinensis TaxID=425677 RepID=A0ABU0JEW5_9HYPH|nr:hypothetical protein [Labrys wisconsinensis]MDQ0472820.1 prophage tail gpP-like protein [Labrys wisconsinensis]